LLHGSPPRRVSPPRSFPWLPCSRPVRTTLVTTRKSSTIFVVIWEIGQAQEHRSTVWRTGSRDPYYADEQGNYNEQANQEEQGNYDNGDHGCVQGTSMMMKMKSSQLPRAVAVRQDDSVHTPSAKQTRLTMNWLIICLGISLCRLWLL
jgi:hypothetical protein